MLKIYNTLSGKKEEFVPLIPGKAGVYVCGPTVYDYIHLGNARSFTAFDMIVRYLRFSGFDVNYVRNITDIDDKIIKRAAEKNESAEAVATFFTKAFHEDLATLGLIVPTHEPRATQSLAGMIALIEKLLASGVAYVAANGDICFEVRKFASYGRLSHRNIDELESGARVEISGAKRDPLDFVLWKMAKPGEPAFASPFGEGRPGWHIECSAMSMSLLGESFDMHGGGRDLTFPHHENEIAQSEAVSGKSFVKYWLHSGYLQMASEKMSKSLGNFLTVRELAKKYNPEVLRYFLLSSHYRSSLSYSEEALVQARSALERLYTALRDVLENDQRPLTGQMDEVPALNIFVTQFIDAMNDDFNTPVAFSVLFDLAHYIQKIKTTSPEDARRHARILKFLGHVCGLLQADPHSFFQTATGAGGEIDAEKIAALIARRNQARAERNWAEADRVRDELKAMSIELEDGAGGTRWRRVQNVSSIEHKVLKQ